VISRFRKDLGFSAVELLFVVAIVGGLAAIGVPISNAIIDDIKLKGDAQTLSAAIARTKMASSAKFTHSRLRVNLNTGTHRVEMWQRTGVPGWVAGDDEVRLSDRARFGFSTVAAAPPNTQAVIAQAPQCRDDLDVPIANTACVIFNSRGMSVTPAGPVAPTQAFYLNGNAGVFGVIVGPTGQLQVWRTHPAPGSVWRQQ
jgi:prepilin-type N-terminal cleavage/methylation domain-containing protein